MRATSVSLLFLLFASASMAQPPETSERPHANLARVMQAIMFPNSNIIFNVQGQDPIIMTKASGPSRPAA